MLETGKIYRVNWDKFVEEKGYKDYQGDRILRNTVLIKHTAADQLDKDSAKNYHETMAICLDKEWANRTSYTTSIAIKLPDKNWLLVKKFVIGSVPDKISDKGQWEYFIFLINSQLWLALDNPIKWLEEQKQ